jgi:cysteine desulfurase
LYTAVQYSGLNKNIAASVISKVSTGMLIVQAILLNLSCIITIERVYMPDKYIYMDHAATTPVDPTVLETMLPYFTEKFGNASTLYSLGREANEASEIAREQVASGLGEKSSEIIFTSGGTESDNLAVKGVAYARKEMTGHIVTTSIEHAAIIKTCERLEDLGFGVTYLPVDKDGLVSKEDLVNALRDDTFLVSIGYANSEIGTIQDIKEFAKLAHDGGALFHSDAVQAIGKFPIDVKDLGVDLLSMSSHKIYGPKGMGALFVKSGIRLAPTVHGGGHEMKMRSGTENVPGMVGFGKAVDLGIQRMDENRRIQDLRDRLISGILGEVDHSYLNGHPEKRLSNNAHFRFSFIEGEAIILNLDYLGLAASTGSACSSKSLKASHILLAIGLKPEEAHGSLRLTMGRENTDEEVDRVLDILPGVVEKLRKMSPLKAQ